MFEASAKWVLFAEEEFVSPFLAFWCSVETLGSIPTYPKGSRSTQGRIVFVLLWLFLWPLWLWILFQSIRCCILPRNLRFHSDRRVGFSSAHSVHCMDHPNRHKQRVCVPVWKTVFHAFWGKTASRFHVNTYLGEILGRSPAPWFISHSAVIIKSSSLVLKPWWLKGHLSQMEKVVDYQTKAKYGRV